MPTSGFLKLRPCGVSPRSSIRTAALLMVVVAESIVCGADKKEPEPLPKFSEIEKSISEYFSGLSNRKQDDVLVKSDVGSALKAVEKLGWKVPDRKDIQQQALADGDHMVREFRTPQGRKFMRRISKFPGGYDRLDRLRKMPYGRRRIRELIRNPDGDQLIKYMTTTRGGKNLGKQIARGKKGRGFNKSTGKLYTTKDLLARLKQSYQAEQARRKKKSKTPKEPTDARKNRPR